MLSAVAEEFVPKFAPPHIHTIPGCVVGSCSIGHKAMLSWVLKCVLESTSTSNTIERFALGVACKHLMPQTEKYQYTVVPLFYNPLF